jgi:hypothetical protein
MKFNQEPRTRWKQKIANDPVKRKTCRKGHSSDATPAQTRSVMTKFNAEDAEAEIRKANKTLSSSQNLKKNIHCCCS